MSNKEGQQTKTGNQESQGKQPHQKESKRASQLGPAVRSAWLWRFG